MAEDLTQLNKAAHKFGHYLLDSGINIIRIAYKLKPTEFSRIALLTFLSDQLGLPFSTLSLADEKYFVETWGKWGEIIDFDLIDQQIYVADHRDCDNFASLYSARSSMIYGLNTCALVYGNIYDAKTKKFLFRHAFNLILTHENGALKLYLYEPQTDESVNWIKGQDNALQKLGWIYRPDWILMQ
jgi:hypothetical protein